MEETRLSEGEGELSKVLRSGNSAATSSQQGMSTTCINNEIPLNKVLNFITFDARNIKYFQAMKLHQNSPMVKYPKRQSHWRAHPQRNRTMINRDPPCGSQNLWMERSKYQAFCRVMLMQSKSNQVGKSQIRRAILPTV